MCNDGERVGVGKGCQVYYQLSIQIQCILSILSNNIPAKIGVRDSNLNECTHVQGKSLRVYGHVHSSLRILVNISGPIKMHGVVDFVTHWNYLNPWWLG